MPLSLLKPDKHNIQQSQLQVGKNWEHWVILCGTTMQWLLKQCTNTASKSPAFNSDRSKSNGVISKINLKYKYKDQI